METLSAERIRELFDNYELHGVASAYKKHVKVAWRDAVPGETVIAICSGTIETVQHIKDNNWIVIRSIAAGTSGEQYAITKDRFAKRYTLIEDEKIQPWNEGTWSIAQAHGEIEGFIYEGPPMKFIAWFGEEMYCEDGDIIAQSKGTKDLYRIARKEFDVTYREVQ